MGQFKYNLGVEAKDVITGFTGTVTSRTEHITGCNTYGILPSGTNEQGKTRDTEWFDEMRIEVKEPGTMIKLPLWESEDPGAGPNPPASNKQHQK